MPARSSGRRLVVVAVGALAAGYLGLCVLVFLSQRQILYPAPVRGGELPAHLSRPLPSAPELPVLYRPAPESGSTIVFFHGNAESIDQLGPLADAFAERGLGFLAVEYPGYGHAPGRPTEAGLYASASAGLDWLEGEGVPSRRVVLLGRSLGGGVATEMARHGRGGGLVLVSTFTSVTDMGALAFPWLPASLLVRDRFDNAAKAAEVRMPALVLHGTNDRVIPHTMSETLASQLPDAELGLVPRRGHDDVLETAQLDRVAEFARRVASQ